MALGDIRCPGGESPEQMTARIDGVIEKIRTLHRKYLEEGIGKRDVIIVAHGEYINQVPHAFLSNSLHLGHFSRVFITRWLRLDLMLGAHLGYICSQSGS
jgi:broad specificity phosphatase PhoE